MEIKIQNWLRNQVTVENSDGPCVRFELHHITEDSKIGLQVVSVDARGEAPEEEWFETTSSFLAQSAMTDADGVGGVQMYAVLCYRKNKPDKVSARCVVRAVGRSDDDYGHINSEPATEKGLLRQLMRHNEANEKTLITGMATLMRHFDTVIDKLSHQNDNLLVERMEIFQTLERLKSEEHERQLQTRESDNRQRLLTDGLQTVKQLAPAVLSSFVKGRGGDPSNLQMEGLKSFFESLNDTQKMSIIQSLDERQQIVLMELLQSLQPQKEYEQ